MPIQFQNFTPNDQKHYTLAETQSEKEAEMSRQMARDAANNAAESANRAMSVDSSNQQHAMSLAQNAKQAGVENGLNQQRINGDNTRVGLANAREMEKTRADVAQNDITNKRQALADQNTLQQQGLTNARTAKENTQKDAEYQRKLAIENQHSFFNNIGTHVLLGEGSNNIDVSSMKQDFSNIYGDAIPKDGALSLNKNKAGGYDLMGFANGQATQLQREGNQITYSPHALDMFASSAKASMFGSKGKDIFQYEDDNGNIRLALRDPSGNVIDVTPNGTSNSELAALNATKETNKNTDAPVVNSQKVNDLTGQTPVVQADNSGGLGNARRKNITATTDANGVTSYSNKAMPSAPAPAQVQGLAGQGPAKAVNKQPTTNQLLSEKQAQQQYNEALRTISHLSNNSNLSPAEQDQLANAKQFKDKYLRSANNVQ